MIISESTAAREAPPAPSGPGRRRARRGTARLARLALLLALGGCAALGSPASRAAFELQILHSSDNESGFVDPATLEPRILHYAALVEGLRMLAPGGPPDGGRHSIHLTAGDHTLPGPFYRAAAEVASIGARGLADIAIFNAMGLTANGMGNHEFDGGIDDFARMLAAARYPFIAANLDFSRVRLRPGTPAIRAGRDGGSVAENAGTVVRSAYVEVGGHRIGIIGRAPADFFNIVARPAETLPGLDFVGGRNPTNHQPQVPALGQVLEEVTRLERQGIDKIILVDHAQDFTADPLSTKDLRGIDVVITAGSTGFTAAPTARGPFNRLRPGDRPLGEYPVRRLDRDGNPVLIVNSDQLYRYVGHLIVGFDGVGRVIHVDPRSGPVATTSEAVADLARIVGKSIEPPAEITRLYGELSRTPMIERLLRVVGATRVPLNGERGVVRTRDTNLGQLVADAMLWLARTRGAGADLALTNGGGIRASIPAPQITGFTVASALAFDNAAVVVEVTAAGLLAAMENGVSRLPASDGRFPQLAGGQLEYDIRRPGVSDARSLDTPSRVRTLRVARASGGVDTVVADGRLVGDAGRRFAVVTNDFLAGGGDGYQALKAAASAPGARVTPLPARAQQTLIEYLDRALGRKVDLADPVAAPRVMPVAP